uniref:Helicase ATP-binding domain-containing protein n=1 Tax=Setaria viridis TaxID=4556 RepID=A0A4U6TGA0_SETVI|nr:LOW QUALITY PROTEIN: hypothetical protein SEVIR_8G170100v2 [Setaria viridis]
MGGYQHAYMGELKRAIDARGHALLEVPTGTGKTATLISLITSYSLANRSRPLRLIYCTRTMHEMEKTLAELRLLFAHLPPAASRSLLALGLSSPKNLCVHPRPPSRPGTPPPHGLLGPREGRLRSDTSLMPPGVYTLADLRDN